jgi:hypothetical protein
MGNRIPTKALASHADVHATAPELVRPPRVSGTITALQRSRGVGTLLGDDRKHYTFRRSDVQEVWFHDLTEGTTVAFEPARHLSAIHVRPVRSAPGPPRALSEGLVDQE